MNTQVILELQENRSYPPILYRLSIVKDFAWIGIGTTLLLLSIIFNQIYIFTPLRIFLSVLFVFFLPGYSLVCALFPVPKELKNLERIGLSLGLSVAIVPLLALILDAHPSGLALWPIIGGELSVIIVGMGVAIARRVYGIYSLDDRSCLTPKTTNYHNSWKQYFGFHAIHFVEIGIIAVLLFVIFYSWSFSSKLTTFMSTEFYITENVEVNNPHSASIQINKNFTTSLVITNREPKAQTYYIEVRANNPDLSIQDELLARTEPFGLESGARLVAPISWSLSKPWRKQNITFSLFASVEPEQPDAIRKPLRRLSLWLDVSE